MQTAPTHNPPTATKNVPKYCTVATIYYLEEYVPGSRSTTETI